MRHYDRINRVLEYIEAHLFEPLNPNELASHSCLSDWHFQRTFQALIRQPCMRYIRKRRLSRAAEILLKKQSRLLDLALDCQFESQEAFTRAFKSQFGITPGCCNDIRTLAENMQPPIVINNSYLNQLFGESIMEPTLKYIENTNLVGLSAAFIPGKNNQEVIPKLWRLFEARKNELGNAAARSRAGIGVVNCLPQLDVNTQTTELVYLAGCQVESLENIPEGMWATRLAPKQYACFKTSCRDNQISRTIDYIYGQWLPKSGYTRDSGPELEFYSESFDTDDEQIFEIAIPIAAV